MTNQIAVKAQVTMSSLEIAELLGKRHDNVMRDIETMLDGLGLAQLGFQSSYLGVNNQRRKCYNLPVAMVKECFLSTVNQHRVHGERERGALCAIEQLLGIKLIRQYKVGKYRIDGYCVETNTAYEIDEEQHFVKGELKQECKDRQSYIESVLGCSFVRTAV